MNEGLATMADKDLSAYEAPIDRTQRSGSIGLVFAVAVLLVGASIAITFMQEDRAGPYILVFLGALAVIGIFALFALAIGVLNFGGRAVREDFARAFVAGADDGILVTDADGGIIFANRAYLALTGAEGAEDARPIERVFAGDPDVAEAVYRLSQAAREGKKAQEEFRVASSRSGGPAWFRASVYAPESARKELIWTLSNVTRERDRQENIFQELQHAIDFLDHAPAGFFSAEADGAIGYMNATLAGWLDYDLTRIGSGGLVVGDILANDSVLLLSATGAPGTVTTEVIDVDLKTRGGQSMPVRLLHKVATAPDGTPGASRTLVLDRSRGTGVPDPLRAAEVRFARFFNNTPIAIATVDRSGRIARSNAAFARLFGDIIKNDDERSITQALGERDRAALALAIEAAAQGRGDLVPLDAQFAGPANRSARFFVSPVEEDEGDDEAAIVYALDTTEQRALEAQFAQSQKMQAIGQLAGGVAHDFNNVLTAIIGYSDLLLASHRPTDPSFQDIMQIKQNANRAAGLVRQLLAFSRRQTLRPQVLALNDVLAEVRILLARLLGEKVTLDVVHGRDLWFVKADINQLEQVVINLAVNARDAMPEGGTLTVRTRNLPEAEVPTFGETSLPAANYVLIEVSDTGTGMEPEILEKIFEPFFSTKEVGKGTGLGLSTVYGIVKQTGGFVFVKSKLGEGSTFQILLPQHIPAETAPEKAVEAPAAQADMTGRGTVLLVEDEDAVRAFGARALASRGYTVLEASSGVEALAIVDEGAHIDLVVSDVVMPEMDGPTLLRELRARSAKYPIIFVSGYAEDAFKKNLGEEEQFSFLPKPFTLKQLVQAVKDTMP
ncbi:signal transduction histidine kinase [Agaricicola taiwanensis]|uniref:histidine kinase n=2 Tax=Agaricicola taiwanensis TaxID=591372 RepID=A0A8J2YGR7_9RHOB|nr:signal transduction histidine kinase [Agaricicola taiwanensis]